MKLPEFIPLLVKENLQSAIENKMTRQQLYEGYLEIYEEFYSIKNIIKRLPNDRHQRVPYLLFNFFYRKFGKIVSKIAIFGLMNYLGKLAGKLSYGID